MANFPQSFRFEQSAVPLADGTFFRPLIQGTGRWVVSRKSMYEAAPGHSFLILYELTDGTFIMVEYGLCERCERRGDQEIWFTSSPPRAERIQPEQALNFILRNQLPIPESLSELLTAGIQKPKCRPLEFWSTQPILDHDRPQIAQNVDLLVQAELGYRFLVQLVQELRTESARWYSLKSPGSVASCLFAVYPVDPKEWWGSREVIPPEKVAFEDLPWPQELATVLDCLVKLKSLLRIPLSAQQAIRYVGTSWYPNAEELEAAFQAMRTTLPALEPLVVELGKAVALAQAAELAPQAGPTTEADSSEATTDNEPKRGAGPADRDALASYERGLQLMGDAGKNATDREVHDWIAEHGLDGDLDEYVLPEFGNWQRYRNRARKAREAGGVTDESLKPRSAVDREEI